MIARIGNIQVAVRVQRDAPRVVELPRVASRTAEDLDRPLICIKNLDSIAAEFADIFVSRPINSHIVGVAEFPDSVPGPAMSPKPFAITIKNLDSMVAGIGHKKPIVGAEPKALRTIELA